MCQCVALKTHLHTPPSPRSSRHIDTSPSLVLHQPHQSSYGLAMTIFSLLANFSSCIGKKLLGDHIHLCDCIKRLLEHCIQQIIIFALVISKFIKFKVVHSNSAIFGLKKRRVGVWPAKANRNNFSNVLSRIWVLKFQCKNYCISCRMRAKIHITDPENIVNELW